MARDDTDKDVEWDTLRMELMDTLAVSELPDTSMTCAPLRALLDILSINMRREEAAHRQHPERVWGVATESERIHHPAERRMLPVLDLDPAIKPAGTIEAVAVLRNQPLQVHQAGNSSWTDLALLEGREVEDGLVF